MYIAPITGSVAPLTRIPELQDNADTGFGDGFSTLQAAIAVPRQCVAAASTLKSASCLAGWQTAISQHIKLSMCKAPRLAIGIVVAAVSLMGVHGATDSEAQLTQLTVDGDDLDSPLIPSAEQVAAAQEAWARRILQADETGREAQLHARLRAAKRLPSTRRGLQSGGDDMWAGMWKYESAILSGSMAGSIGGSSALGADDRILSSPTESDGDAAATAALLGAHPDGNVCDDSLAENVGTAGPCSYDCEVLQQRFFPESTRTTRCFLYTETGWRADGEPMGEELMDMRNDRLDWHTCTHALSCASSCTCYLFALPACTVSTGAAALLLVHESA